MFWSLKCLVQTRHRKKLYTMRISILKDRVQNAAMTHVNDSYWPLRETCWRIWRASLNMLPKRRKWEACSDWCFLQDKTRDRRNKLLSKPRFSCTVSQRCAKLLVSSKQIVFGRKYKTKYINIFYAIADKLMLCHVLLCYILLYYITLKAEMVKAWIRQWIKVFLTIKKKMFYHWLNKLLV